jgi:nucleotide-binding universal stress UspA family protein
MWKCPPSTILVPVDFGDASARAVAVGASVAARLGGRLRLLHAEAIETPPYFTHEQLKTIERERNAARAQAREYLARFARSNGATDFEVKIPEGSASAAIIDAARAADLVVMGTHGRRGPSRWWMGSVAERVVHESVTPVLVVRSDLGGLAMERIFERPLVVSAAGEGGDAARVAAGLSDAFGGRVADHVATCQADLAHDQQATMIVVSKAPAHGIFSSHGAEHWLRSCTLPMLFVPATVMA